MDILRTKLTVLLLGLMTAGSATAGNDLWLGVKAGTLGLGLETIWRPIPLLDLRAGFNRYEYEDVGSQAGVNYDATLQLDTYYVTANFLFPVSPFRITAGAFSNRNELQMASTTQTSFDIGDFPYTPAQVGTLRSTTYFEDVAPYLGVGFDFSIAGKVGLNLDFGVLWQGEPLVTLTSDGTLATDPSPVGDFFRQNLEEERLQLETEFEDYKAFPVMSLGFTFNFF
uniref:Outer membrane protein beta-barrel domain-containing protein n=1 Tax=uncultured marine microorganism TaxID=415540 RepID=A5CFU9_9ZZZZ|nr:hypothetical protein [uncultured marine microorganism]